MYQDYLVPCDAVIYGETGATMLRCGGTILSFLSDVVFVAASGYTTTMSSTLRQNVGSTWVDVSRVCCIEHFCTVLCEGFTCVICMSISIDYNAVCTVILETFGVL